MPQDARNTPRESMTVALVKIRVSGALRLSTPTVCARRQDATRP